MASEIKDTMLSARVPADLVARVDYIVRNTEGADTRSRSAAIQTALETWLPVQEERLVVLGILPKKVR